MATFGLVVGVAMIAALGGYLFGRSNPRHARRVFIAGFVCGSVAGSVLRGQRRRLANRALRRVLPVSDPRRCSRARVAPARRPQRVRQM